MTDGHKWSGGRVECPACHREAYTNHRANLCRCGRWFAIEPPTHSDQSIGVYLIDGPGELRDAIDE